jgi:hypothetical protein
MKKQNKPAETLMQWLLHKDVSLHPPEAKREWISKFLPNKSARIC